MDANLQLTDDEKDCLENANNLRAKQGQLALSGFVGRENEDNGGPLPIYQLDYATLIANFPNFSVLTNNNPADKRSMAHQYCSSRRENHNDKDQHLPDLPYDYDDPTNLDGYYEYHIDNSGVKSPKNLRIVFDSGRNRLYISPSHYNLWKDNNGNLMNPFFLVTNCPPGMQCGGNVDFS